MEDHAYFLAIEEAFIGLRGAPLLLSPADWQVASRWHREGIPLDVVLETLEEIFARRRQREEEAPVSLRYCAPAVERAWKRVRRLGEAAERRRPEPIDLGERLAALAEALPDTLPGSDELRARILALRGGHEQVEKDLGEIDRELLRTAAAELEPRARERLEEAAAAGAERAGGRLAASELEATRRRLFERLLRREMELPVLSLFGR